MKKTIITLMALAGVAFGADYTVENVWTVNFGSAYTNGYEATGSITSITQTWDIVAVEGGAQTSGEKRVHLRDDKFGSWDSDFEFSITLTLGDPISASNNWPVFFELADSDSNKLRVGPYIAAGNTVDMDGNVTKNEERAASVTAGGTHTITLTKIGNSVSAAVDGVVSSTGTINYSGTINNITLGGDTNGYYKLNSVVHSISMSSITVVPEPATATLSLLALCGLAARRRRK